ncbi:MAG: hypothetical protein IT186_15940 [Acidobacteria bacterium]|nr:hypothetical protein [Acidobacteriota bacterium]
MTTAQQAVAKIDAALSQLTNDVRPRIANANPQEAALLHQGLDEAIGQTERLLEAPGLGTVTRLRRLLGRYLATLEVLRNEALVRALTGLDPESKAALRERMFEMIPELEDALVSPLGIAETKRAAEKVN